MRDGRLVAISLKAGSVELLIGQDDGAKGWDRVKGEGLSLQTSTTQKLDALAYPTLAEELRILITEIRAGKARLEASRVRGL
jgi:hypothetical protein